MSQSAGSVSPSVEQLADAKPCSAGHLVRVQYYPKASDQPWPDGRRHQGSRPRCAPYQKTGARRVHGGGARLPGRGGGAAWPESKMSVGRAHPTFVTCRALHLRPVVWRASVSRLVRVALPVDGTGRGYVPRLRVSCVLRFAVTTRGLCYLLQYALPDSTQSSAGPARGPSTSAV